MGRNGKITFLTVLIGKKHELGVGELLVVVLAVRSCKVSRARMMGLAVSLG